ncbi:MAG TPA: hybrid sensor histidine kinase/response regulator [Gammaproteobacteria bacterium]|nr:hybrid sensor histidine kinase/response regulator [Gammaproteobacteria bacterium]
MDGDELYSRVEHNARTLLNAANGTTQILSSLVKQAIQSQKDVSPVVLKPHLKNLHDLFEEFGRTLDSFSDFIRMQKGENNTSTIRAIDFAQLLERVSYPFVIAAKEKGIGYRIDYHDEASPIVYGDPIWISQIMHHLLGNAFKYTTSGKVEIVVASSWTGSKNPMLEVSVVDTGPGLDTSDDSAEHSWTELGLALVKHFVEALGGRISVNTISGKGTRVTFTLPVTNRLLDDSITKELSSLRIWGVRCEESLSPDLETQLQFPRLVSEILPLKEVIFKLQQTPNAELPHIIIVVGRKLTQNMSYFARAFESNPLFRNILLVLTLSPEHCELDAQQAYANGYQSVMPVEKYILFAEALVETWTRWRRKGEHAVNVKSQEASRKVLVIEDHLINQKVIKMLLAEMGLDADIASHGRAGLKAIDKNSYGAVIVDLGLPDISGLDVISEIRSRGDEKSTIPIIVLTAGGHRETIDEIQERQIDAYLLKPVTITQLHEVLAPFVKLESRQAA